MKHIECDVAVIGAGSAGLHAWKAADAAGAHAVIIEKGEGGSTCTRVGCMPSKALIAAARAVTHARRADLFGVRVTGVEVDGPAVMRRVRAERDKYTDVILEQYHAIPTEKSLHGVARLVAPDRLMVGDDLELSAKAIVIATGSYPLVPEPLGPVRALVHTNETIFEIDDLPASLAVIGAGPLGLELAQAFSRLGVEVTVLDKGDKVGALADPECEKAARAALTAEFPIHLGVEFAAAMVDGKARLTWDGGAVTVDAVLAATGRPPQLDELNLDAAAIPRDGKGSPCFAEASRRVGKTSIFVAGDAGGWRPVLHEASRGGRIAGRDAGGLGESFAIPALAIAFTEPNLVEVGTRFDTLPDGARIGTALFAENGRAQTDGDDAGLVRIYTDRDGKLIGGTLVGTGAEHLGQSLAMAIQCGIDAVTLVDMAWYHPTLEEALQAAAREVDPEAAVQGR